MTKSMALLNTIWSLADTVAEEHAAILRQRSAEMDSPNAIFFTWEEAQVILKKNKSQKTNS